MRVHRLIALAEKNGFVKTYVEGDFERTSKYENILKEKYKIKFCEVIPNDLESDNPINMLGAAGGRFIMNQINNNWTRPPGIKNIENLTIKLVITLDINGYVTSISIPSSTDKIIKEDKSLKPYLDSAIRAIKKSSPFEGLQKHRYNIWKKININFMPFEANQ